MKHLSRLAVSLLCVGLLTPVGGGLAAVAFVNRQRRNRFAKTRIKRQARLQCQPECIQHALGADVQAGLTKTRQ